MENQENNQNLDKETLPEMDDGFFAEPSEKGVQRIPAPVQKRKSGKKAWKIVGCILLAVAIFASPFFTRKFLP